MSQEHQRGAACGSSWTRRQWALLFAGLALYFLAGMNPHMLPESTDDIVYFELAESWANGTGHRFQGEVIGDWPPVYPWFLALPMLLGIKSLLLAKLMTLLTALLGLWLMARLCLAERREPAGLLILLTGLLTMSCLFAVRPAGDWLFVVWSFLFLLVLHRLQGPRPWVWALLAGMLLGLASLTRFVGVLLGAAVVSQVIGKLFPGRYGSPVPWRGRLASVVPEALASCLGGGLWFAWQMYLGRMQSQGLLARGNYDQKGLELWSHFDPHRLLSEIGAAYFQSGNLLEKAGLADTPLVFAMSLLLGLVLFAGLWRTWKRGLWQPADAYGLATILLVLPYEFKATRYWFVIAPILLSWIFRGVAFWTAPARRRWPGWPWHGVKRVALAAWMAVLAAAWGLYCFKGNGADHRGLNWFAAGGADHFYLGRNGDLRRACLRIAGQWPGAGIGIDGWFANYAHWFTSGLHAVRHDFYPDAFDTFVHMTHDPLPGRVAQDFKQAFQEGEVTVYRKK